MHLKLKRKRREDYMKVGESKQWFEYRIVKIVCSLEGGLL
jgi:hypothetical protein